MQFYLEALDRDVKNPLKIPALALFFARVRTRMLLNMP
jgi:hypothetical protein